MKTKTMRELFDIINENNIVKDTLDKAVEYNFVCERRKQIERYLRIMCNLNYGEIFVTIGGSYAIYCQTMEFPREPHDYDFVVWGDERQLRHIKAILTAVQKLTIIANGNRTSLYGECFPLRDLYGRHVDLLFNHREGKHTNNGDAFENLLDIKDIKETWNRQAKARGAEPRQKDVDDVSFIDWWLHKEDDVDLPF